MNAPFKVPQETTGKPAQVKSSKAKQSPRKQTDNRHSLIERLLILEAQVREVQSVSELQFLIANETRKLISCRQILVHVGTGSKRRWPIAKISSVSEVNRYAPLPKWLESTIPSVIQPDDGNLLKTYDLPEPDSGLKYPFRKGCSFKIRNRKGKTLGGVSLLSERLLSETEMQYAARLAGTYSHAWNALQPKPPIYTWFFGKTTFLAALVAIGLIGVIPVPLTVLAPAEIVPKDAFVVAAPLNGVVEDIIPSPNTHVKKGDVLFNFVELDLRNSADISERNLAVAEARFLRASQSAFSDPEGRRELSVLKAEYTVAKAEHEYAASQLAKAKVLAPKTGLVLFSTEDDWRGKPVAIGERIMRIADPEQFELRIDVPVADAMILSQEISGRVFLDAEPLAPQKIKLTTTSYAAEKNGDNPLAFPLRASLDNTDYEARIGWRGTAQLSGDTVPLAYNLFRKPLSKIRQFLGI